MGELDGDLRPSGNGNLFLKTGCILRGRFEKNLVEGKCLITLPLNVLLVLKCRHGVLDSWMTKIDLVSQRVTYFKFTKGLFQEDKEGDKFTRTIQETLKDIFPANLPLRGVKEFPEGTYFGSFEIRPGQVFNGLIQDGKPTGWGITLTFEENSGPGNKYYKKCFYSNL